LAIAVSAIESRPTSGAFLGTHARKLTWVMILTAFCDEDHGIATRAGPNWQGG
jgi:hypothetical protein